MSCSSCAERREAIVRAAQAAGAGDRDKVAKEAAFVVKSSAEDIASGFKRTVAAARARLSAKR